MLLRFEVSNFRSFYRKTSFDMFPNRARTQFSNHIYSDREIPLLKIAAIYGANGAGKSNFIKAFDFLRDFVLQYKFLEGFDLDSLRFQLAKQPTDAISFCVEFFYNDQYYIYDVTLATTGLEEKLFLSGLGKKAPQLLLERRGTAVLLPELAHGAMVTSLLERHPNASLLALNTEFPILEMEAATDAYTWFSQQTEVVTLQSVTPQLIEFLSRTPEVLDFTNRLFSHIGLGINSVAVTATPLEEWVTQKRNDDELRRMINDSDLPLSHSRSIMQNGRNILSITKQEGEKRVLELLFDQLGQDGFHKTMPITAQSDGTVKLLVLAPALYDAVRNGKTVFIDELDNSIHPDLIFKLLDFYGRNPSNGQLIFTTHATILLNQQELLRPDEIWLTAKENGATQMYSLNEYKLDNTPDIERGYLEGRYGGVPVVTINDTDDAL